MVRELSKQWKFYNVIMVGLNFQLLFTGFQTCGMISQTVLGSYKKDHPSFTASGYTSLAILYGVFSIANWVAPSIVSIFGPKISMIFGGITYTLYIVSYIKPLEATIYAASALIGVGAAVIWTAQGNFLTINSTKDTMGRNSGLFWALFQCSLLFGNIYVFFAWNGVDHISDAQRIPLYIVLSILAGIGTLTMLFLRSAPKPEPVTEEDPQQAVNESDSLVSSPVEDVDVKTTQSSAEGPMQAFLKAVQLFKQTDMLLLSVMFFYTGLELTFFSGVYTTCVGATQQLGDDSDKWVGLTGIMIGVGEILGGLTFGIFGKKTIKYGRDPIVFLGMVIHLIAFYLIFLNIPDIAPIRKSLDVAFIQPSVAIAVFCGALLGFGDSCFNTQCFSIVGALFAKNSAPAFAIFKFVQSLSAAIVFLYSAHLLLKYQLLILVIFSILGTLCFFRVEWNNTIRMQYDEVSSSNEDEK